MSYIVLYENMEPIDGQVVTYELTLGYKFFQSKQEAAEFAFKNNGILLNGMDVAVRVGDGA